MDDAPKRIFVPLRDADISKDKVFTNDIEYIRADLHSNLLRAADALADVIQNPVRSDDGFYDYDQDEIDATLSAYNKAKEKANK